MKHISLFLAACLLLFTLCSCGAPAQSWDIAATTLPVYEFTARLCEGTGLTVTRLVTESVSCLHDYSLNVNQVRAAESAQLIVISGAGLEEFMEDILSGKQIIDSSENIEIIECEDAHEHEHDHDHGHDHHHDVDSHIWLSPENASVMANNICAGLCKNYPEYAETFRSNLPALLADIDAVQNYGNEQLGSLSCRDLITFHDGFGYFAAAFDLHILKAVEEESGAEASAAELKELIQLVRQHQLPAIFTETNGSDSAASVISRETEAAVFTLDMAMSGDSWFDAMYHNIDTLKEALE